MARAELGKGPGPRHGRQTAASRTVPVKTPYAAKCPALSARTNGGRGGSVFRDRTRIATRVVTATAQSRASIRRWRRGATRVAERLGVGPPPGLYASQGGDGSPQSLVER